MAILGSNMELYIGYQGKDETRNEYLKAFKSRIETINAHGGAVAPTQHTHKGHWNKWGLGEESRGATLTKEADIVARKKYLVYLFIKQVDNDCCRDLKQLFVDDELKGETTYLVNIDNLPTP